MPLIVCCREEEVVGGQAMDIKIKRATLSMTQWWYLAITVMVTLPIILAFSFMNQLWGFYVVRFVEPEVERELGFEGEPVPIQAIEGPSQIYAIVAVTPGGVFDRAGVKVGDVPAGYIHGQRAEFISQLHDGRGHDVTLHLLSRSKLATEAWPGRAVTVHVP